MVGNLRQKYAVTDKDEHENERVEVRPIFGQAQLTPSRMQLDAQRQIPKNIG